MPALQAEKHELTVISSIIAKCASKPTQENLCTPNAMLPSIVPRIQQKVLEQQIVANSPKLARILAHPAGPFTIHFWAPTFKWAISIANIADMRSDPENISVLQQLAVAGGGLIWSRYSTVITPVNWNLLAVNFFMAGTGIVQLYRKFERETAKTQYGTAKAAVESATL